MQFDWNEEKAKSNLAKHRISFEEATTVFNDPLFLTFADPEHSVKSSDLLLWESQQKDDC